MQRGVWYYAGSILLVFGIVVVVAAAAAVLVVFIVVVAVVTLKAIVNYLRYRLFPTHEWPRCFIVTTSDQNSGEHLYAKMTHRMRYHPRRIILYLFIALQHSSQTGQRMPNRI